MFHLLVSKCKLLLVFDGAMIENVTSAMTDCSLLLVCFLFVWFYKIENVTTTTILRLLRCRRTEI